MSNLLEGLHTFPDSEPSKPKNSIEILVNYLVSDDIDDENLLQSEFTTPELTLELSAWWRYCLHMTELSLNEFTDSAQLRLITERFLKVKSHLVQAEWSTRMDAIFDINKNDEINRQLHLQLVSSTSLSQVFSTLETAAKNLGLQRIFIALYKSPGSLPDTEARLAFYWLAQPHSQHESSWFDTKYWPNADCLFYARSIRATSS